MWLDVLAPELALDRRIGVLCRRHADAMVVPLGWMLDDHREPTPRLFKVAETDATGEVARRRRPAAARSAHSEQLELVVPGLPVVADEPTVGEQIADLLADDTAQIQRTVEMAVTDQGVTPEPVRPEPVEPQPAEPEPAPAIVEPPEPAEPQPEPHSEPVSAEPEPAAALEEQNGQATLWTPVFDPADDLGGLLTASSPLLSRAFGTGSSAPQRRRKARKRS